MKLAVSAILFVLQGSLIGAHNVRVGKANVEKKEVNKRTHPEIKRSKMPRSEPKPRFEPKNVSGEPCVNPEDCESGMCTFLGENYADMVCVDCYSNYDCSAYPGFERCMIDPIGVTANYCGPMGGLGEACMEAGDCESGMCTFIGENYADMVCVDCYSNDDCSAYPGFERCMIDPIGVTANHCGPMGTLGEACMEAGDCESGMCTFIGENHDETVCVDCYSNADCSAYPGFERCMIDPTGVNPNHCGPMGTLGQACVEGGDCESGMCTFIGENHDETVCVDCYSNADCSAYPGFERCMIDPIGVNPNQCGPKAGHGQACMVAGDCESGMCTFLGENYADMVCVDCYSNADCSAYPGFERCMIDPIGVIANECGPKAGHGEACMEADDCESGMCTFIGENYADMVCVDCYSDADCSAYPGFERCMIDPIGVSANYCGP